MDLRAKNEVFIVLILVCVEVSVGEVKHPGSRRVMAYVLILVCVEVSVGAALTKKSNEQQKCLNPCLCGS